MAPLEKKAKMSKLAVGIDLGTVMSCVAVNMDNEVDVISDEFGKQLIPSYVAYTDKGILTGTAARDQAFLNPQNTIYDTKWMLGHKYKDDVIQKKKPGWPFTVVDEDGAVKLEVEYKGEREEMSPAEIATILLSKLKDLGDGHAGAGADITSATITIPAYFTDNQKQYTKNACHAAGFAKVQVLEEPVAATLAYQIESEGDTCPRNVLVFDLGGGSFDLTVLSVYPGPKYFIRSTGVYHNAVDKFDEHINTYFVREFEKQHGMKVESSEPRSMRRLAAAALHAKHALSTDTEAHVEVDSFLNDKDLRSRMSRAKFEELCHEEFKLVIDEMESVVAKAKLERGDVTDVVLVGGSTHIPKLKQMICDHLPHTTIHHAIDPELVVVHGAARYAAAVMAGEEAMMTVSCADNLHL